RAAVWAGVGTASAGGGGAPVCGGSSTGEQAGESAGDAAVLGGSAGGRSAGAAAIHAAHIQQAVVNAFCFSEPGAARSVSRRKLPRNAPAHSSSRRISRTWSELNPSSRR